VLLPLKFVIDWFLQDLKNHQRGKRRTNSTLFLELVKLIDCSVFTQLVNARPADKYSKGFELVSMLSCQLSGASSLREHAATIRAVLSFLAM
jgi:hypothetical protein